MHARKVALSALSALVLGVTIAGCSQGDDSRQQACAEAVKLAQGGWTEAVARIQLAGNQPGAGMASPSAMKDFAAGQVAGEFATFTGLADQCTGARRAD